ncbi:MAG: hypothetical protein ACRDK2_08490 [Solirubrobacteraceae bacterium]
MSEPPIPERPSPDNSSVSPASPASQQRPELALAGAFAGGMLLALLLRRGRS